LLQKGAKVFNGKNTRVHFEVLPDGKPIIECYVRPGEVKLMVALLTAIFNKTLLPDTLHSVEHFGLKAGRQEETKIIVEGYTRINEQLDEVPSGRNPMIKPDEVFKRFHQRMNDEGEQ
jgi:hypothetical protein